MFICFAQNNHTICLKKSNHVSFYIHHKQEYNIAQDKMQKSLKSVPDLDECEERKREKDLNVGF